MLQPDTPDSAVKAPVKQAGGQGDRQRDVPILNDASFINIHHQLCQSSAVMSQVLLRCMLKSDETKLRCGKCETA